MIVGQPHLIGFRNRIFPITAAATSSEEWHSANKSMKLKRQHPVELAIKIKSLSSCSGRKYSIRIGEGGDFTFTFAEAVVGGMREEKQEETGDGDGDGMAGNVSPRSLIVMDELGRATSADGFAIAWSCCEHLLALKSVHSMLVGSPI
ncbi:hypothetical protein MRB53_027526 [Persea americana]|uniref:Uncharacterized protein n=1 Tax=Persea americana TaxID=3435 RepID=A0ACC2LLN3_PERAE|nr:hypothetical protein MRB53_027526 [Persea americana]